MGLIFPVDSQEVDGDASQHDGQADAANHRLRVKGEDEQEGPEDEVNDGPDQADLQDMTHSLLDSCKYIASPMHPLCYRCLFKKSTWG